MKTRLSHIIALSLMLSASSVHAADRTPTLQRSAVIEMADVEGRIDHMAVDISGHRLFVAALGNNTLEVLDLKQGSRLHTIAGLREPQGVAYLPDSGRIVVANGEDGACRVFDGHSYGEITRIDFKADADNVRYDALAKRVYVGYGAGALGVVDVERMTRGTNIPLSGHPESFQLEAHGSRIFVNVPSAKQIAVVDRSKGNIIATWPLDSPAANFPMAVDQEGRHLLIGCRKPARLAVIDAETGKVTGSVSCSGDTDDLFYDAQRERIYVSGGDGTISVFGRSDPDHYRLLETIATAAGARTSLFVPATNALYLAVPHRARQKAAIWVYKAP
jgi:DNA-binding beta-propeller fold protein YncE